MVDERQEVERQVIPSCMTERCGKYIITSDGQAVPNTDGECQKNKPTDAWYAMQDPSLCRRFSDDSICWCVVPKCKPVKCGTQAFNERVGTKESKCYSKKQDNMVCRQSGDLCKEIEDPINGSEYFYIFNHNLLHLLKFLHFPPALRVKTLLLLLEI